MRTLLSERFAPTTSHIGFLRLGVDEVAAGLAAWRRELVPGGVDVEEVGGGFPECLHALEPLTQPVRPRELLVEVGSDWTAYFECSAAMPDASSPTSYLARRLGCDAVAVMTLPHTIGRPGVARGRYGSVQFALFGPDRGEVSNHVRSVVASFDTRWLFLESGQIQPFEEPEAYTARRVRDRFTSDMLGRYCERLGIPVFDPDAYGPRAVLVRSHVDVPDGALVLTYAEAQERLGIVPGEADAVPG